MKPGLLRLAGALALLLAGTAWAVADPIEGTWKRPNGTLEIIAACGASYCVTVGSGDYKGKNAGSFARQPDGSYKGKLTEQRTGLTFSGSGTVVGNNFNMSALGGFKKETWTRQ